MIKMFFIIVAPSRLLNCKKLSGALPGRESFLSVPLGDRRSAALAQGYLNVAPFGAIEPLCGLIPARYGGHAEFGLHFALQSQCVFPLPPASLSCAGGAAAGKRERPARCVGHAECGTVPSVIAVWPFRPTAQRR